MELFRGFCVYKVTKQTRSNNMKLTYWKIQCHDDSNIYSIRAKTKKEAIRVYKNMVTNEDGTINESRANSLENGARKKHT